MSDQQPTVINTSSGNGGWAVAIILLIAIVVGGFVLFQSGYLGSRNVNIDVSLPKAETSAPATNAPATK